MHWRTFMRFVERDEAFMPCVHTGLGIRMDDVDRWTRRMDKSQSRRSLGAEEGITCET
jgi:hypothetical protein